MQNNRYVLRMLNNVLLLMMLFVGLVASGTVLAGDTSEIPSISVTPTDDFAAANAGDTVLFEHTIENTGSGDVEIQADTVAPDDWTVELNYTDKHNVAVVLPYTMASGEKITMKVHVTSPSGVKSAIYPYPIVITVSMYTGTVGWGNVEVKDAVEIKSRTVFLPLILRDFPTPLNGSFELGLAGWTMTQVGLPVQVVDGAAERDSEDVTLSDGNKVVLLGNPNYACDGVPQGYAAVQQTFWVPTKATSLEFDYIIWSQDASVSAAYDRFEVYIWREGETQPAEPAHSAGNMDVTRVGCDTYTRVPEKSDMDWAMGSIDVSDYQGQKLTVFFSVYSRYDSYYNTYAYLDNVRIK